MNSRDFAYWLQGFEIADPKVLNEKQVDLIRKHLAMVFVHEIDPSFPPEQQAALDQAHEGNSPPKPPQRPPSFPPTYRC